METPKEMRAKIVGKATGDADFRARLLSDPKGAIEQELGVTIPASLSVEVHEERGTTAHLVLPPTASWAKAICGRSPAAFRCGGSRKTGNPAGPLSESDPKTVAVELPRFSGQ